MNNAKRGKTTSISKAKTIEEVSAFWETHSLADHWAETRPASVEVRATRRRRVTIEPGVYSQIEAQAHRRGVSPETLVNLWLAEQLKQPRRA